MRTTTIAMDNTAARSRRGGSDRRAQFIQCNLSLLGFGNPRDALIQTVKELFENALDAVTSHAQGGPREDAPRAMLRVLVQQNAVTGLVDVVCTDTGTGIPTHEIRQLCCGAFETTKGDASSTSSCGKYGIGLKAATIYAQRHVPDACLRIVTTLNSREILCVQFRIDSESEEPAVVQGLVQYVVDEAQVGSHQQFSGTEMRISIPCPKAEKELEYAADSLATYFQTLRYSLASFIGVEFRFLLGGVEMEVECRPGEEAVFRFAHDFQANMEDIVHYEHEKGQHKVNCMALMKTGSNSHACRSSIEVTLLRFANHVPLLNAEDLFLGAIAKGVSSIRLWKTLGYRCQRGLSPLVNQLVVLPQSQHTREVCEDEHEPNEQADRFQLILAIDITSRDTSGNDAVHNAVEYTSLRKTILDKSYARDVQVCCRNVLQQLKARGSLVTPQQMRDNDLFDQYVPLIANAATVILNKSLLPLRPITVTCNGSKGPNPLHGMCFDPRRVASCLQDLLRQELPPN